MLNGACKHGSDGGQKCHLNNSSEQGKILTVTARLGRWAPRNSRQSRQERITAFVGYGGNIWMRILRVAFIVVVVWLLGVDPVAHAQWDTLKDAVLHAVEVVALPFRLARLAARQPD